MRRGSAGVEAIAVRADRPRANGFSESCCCDCEAGTINEAAARIGAIISAKVPTARRLGSRLRGRPPGRSPVGLSAAPPSRLRGRPPGRSPVGLSAAPPSRRLGARSYLLLKQDLTELVFLARLEDGQHLVPRLELGRADCDLCLAIPHDGDQARALRQPQLLNRLSRPRRAFVDLHLDDLEVLLAQLEQMH